MPGFWETLQQQSDSASQRQENLLNRQMQLAQMQGNYANSSADRGVALAGLLQSGIESQGKIGGDIASMDIDKWKAINDNNYDWAKLRQDKELQRERMDADKVIASMRDGDMTGLMNIIIGLLDLNYGDKSSAGTMGNGQPATNILDNILRKYQ